MNENLEKVKLADRKRQEIARRIKARLDRQRRQELERIRMMNAFAIVSSLGMMTVIDFLLAYWGGDWLDNYFQTGDHFWRKICLGLAGLTFFLAILNRLTKSRRKMIMNNKRKMPQSIIQQRTLNKIYYGKL